MTISPDWILEKGDQWSNNYGVPGGESWQDIFPCWVGMSTAADYFKKTRWRFRHLAISPPGEPWYNIRDRTQLLDLLMRCQDGRMTCLRAMEYIESQLDGAPPPTPTGISPPTPIGISEEAEDLATQLIRDGWSVPIISQGQLAARIQRTLDAYTNNLRGTLSAVASAMTRNSPGRTHHRPQ